MARLTVLAFSCLPAGKAVLFLAALPVECPGFARLKVYCPGLAGSDAGWDFGWCFARRYAAGAEFDSLVCSLILFEGWAYY